MRKQRYEAVSMRRNFSGLKTFILLISVITLSNIFANAQATTATPVPTAVPTAAPTAAPVVTTVTTTIPTTTGAATVPPSLSSLEGVKVVDAANVNEKEKGAGMGDKIIVKVTKLENLVRHANCKSDDDKPVPNCTPQKIVLFLDGREIKNLLPVSGAPEPESETLHFSLKRTNGSDEAWSDLFGAPPFDKTLFYYRPTPVSVGFENGYPLPSTVTKERFELERIRFGWFWTCVVVLCIVFGLLFWLSVYSELLRDVGPLPPARRERKWWTFGWEANVAHRPYSLARFQMAFWFTLVIASFLFIWLINGATNTITTATLALIGIGAGTALGSAVIDLGKNEGNKTELETLKAEELTLRDDLNEINAQIETKPAAAILKQLTDDADSKRKRLNLIQSRLIELGKRTEAKESKNFLLDILTDGANGVSFHRFQMFVWTLILGILFVYQVYYRLSMPDFDTTLLALLGISSGTYLGFKIPELQSKP